MYRIIVTCLIFAGALAWRGAGPAIAVDLEPRLILAPSGTLRAGLYPGTPTSILPDAGSGEPRGVGYDLGKEFARLARSGIRQDRGRGAWIEPGPQRA